MIIKTLIVRPNTMTVDAVLEALTYQYLALTEDYPYADIRFEIHVEE